MHNKIKIINNYYKLWKKVKQKFIIDRAKYSLLDGIKIMRYSLEVFLGSNLF